MLCRLCLKETKHSENILQSQVKCAEWTLVESIYWIFGVRVDINDPHTKIICERCESAIKCIGKYRELYKKNQLILEEKLDLKLQEITSQAANTDESQICTTITQTQVILSPKAKKRRLTVIDHHSKTSTKAIRGIGNEKIAATNAEAEEPMVQVQEVKVKVCKYCSKIFRAKHHLEAHYNSEHTTLHAINLLRKLGELKNLKSQAVVTQTKDPGEENLIQKLDSCENHSNAAVGLGEVADTLSTDISEPECSVNEIKSIIIGELSGSKEDIIKALNKRYKWLKLKDFSIPLTPILCTTSQINRTEVKAVDKSSHASTEIRGWKNNLCGTLQALSQIGQSDTMAQWMNIGTVTRENKETDSENDDNGFDEIAGMEVNNNSEDSESEELPEVDVPDTQHGTGDEAEHVLESIPKIQQMKETDAVVGPDLPKSVPISKHNKEDEVAEMRNPSISQQSEDTEVREDTTKSLSASQKSKVVESQVQETEGTQKKSIVPLDKLTEMQNMKEHILSTLRKIKEIKERTARTSKIQFTEKEQATSDNTLEETKKTIEDTSAESVCHKDDASGNSQEITAGDSAEETSDDNWEEANDGFDETEVADLNINNTNGTGETVKTNQEVVHITVEDICTSDEEDTNTTVIEKEQENQTSKPEQTLPTNAGERIVWQNSISSSLMKLQHIPKIDFLAQPKTSLQLGSVHDPIIIADDSFDEEEHSVDEMNNEVDESSEEDHGEEASGMNNQHTWSNTKDLVVSLVRCANPINPHQNNKVSEANQGSSVAGDLVAAMKKWKNTVPTTLLQLRHIKLNELVEKKMEPAKAAIMSESVLENEYMTDDSDLEKNLIDFVSQDSEKRIKTVTVNQSGDNQTTLETLNNQYKWLNLKDFLISVTPVKVPRKIHQSIITDRTRWKESVSTILPKLKELKENDVIKQKIDLIKTRPNVAQPAGSGAETLDTEKVVQEPEFIDIATHEKEAIANTISNDFEADDADPLSRTVFDANHEEDNENNDNEVIVTVSLSGSSEIPDDVKDQLQLKDFYIPLENVWDIKGETFGLKTWKKHMLRTLLELQTIKEEASEEEKLKISDVTPIGKGSKKIIKLDFNFVRKLSKTLKKKSNAPATDDIYELVVDPNSFEFLAQIININNKAPELNDQSRNTQVKSDSTITVMQNILLNPPLTGEDAEEDQSLTEDMMENADSVSSNDSEKDVPVADCIIETINIYPLQTENLIQDPGSNPPETFNTTGMVVPEMNPESNANLEEEYENQRQPLGDILEQASIWIQQNAEDTDGIVEGKEINLVQIEDLIQKQEKETSSCKDQVSTKKVIPETYEDLVASLGIESVSVQQTTENTRKDVTNDEEIDSLEFEGESDNGEDHETYEALIKSLETEVETQKQLEQTYPSTEGEGINDEQKTAEISSAESENESHEANKETDEDLSTNPEREFKSKKQPAKEDAKSDAQTDSPKMKCSTPRKATEPKRCHKCKKRAKKEKCRSTISPINRLGLNLRDDERVPSTSLVMDQNPSQNSEKEENKAHCSKSDTKPSKQRKKTPNITVMNETDRLTRDVEQLTKYLNILKLMETNQKSLNSSDSKLLSSAQCDHSVKKISDKKQEVQGELDTKNKEKRLAKEGTTDTTEQTTSLPKLNRIDTLTSRDGDGLEKENTNTTPSEKRANEIKIWRQHLSNTLSKIKQIKASKGFNLKINEIDKECENDKDPNKQ